MTDLTATIFNIQKYSIHDGPGIRTVVFFKGCPLSCQWCSNPESQHRSIEISHDQNKCSRCLRCVKECPNKAIEFVDNRIQLNPGNCSLCLHCVKNCPEHALAAEGKDYTIEQVMQEVLKDKVFYEESGGGVTLSGGEVLLQHNFAINLLTELKKQNIQTACETTGYISNDIFIKFIEKLDLLLYDLKHYDREKHHSATAVYNDLIIENLKTAVTMQQDIIIRIPVIPGFNDSLKDAASFSKLLKELNLQQVSLLPFHQFGQNKYQLLNREYQYRDIAQLSPDDISEYKQVFIEHGIECL